MRVYEPVWSSVMVLWMDMKTYDYLSVNMMVYESIW